MVRVKRLISGVWTTILQQANPVLDIGRSMSWAAPAQPLYEDGNITPRFEWQLNGSGGYTAITPAFNGVNYSISLNGFQNGNYDYILSYVLADGRVLARQTGTFSQTAAALTQTSTPVNTNYPADVLLPTVNTTLKRLEWTRAKNDPNDRIVVKYTTPYVTGSQEFFVTAIAGANGLWYVDLAQLGAMSNREVRWEIKYYGGPTQTEASYARIWFAHNLTVTVPAQPTLRVTSQSALFPSQAVQMSVPAFRESDRSLYFTAPALAAADVRFRLNAGQSNEMLLSAVADGAGYRVFLPAVMPISGVLGSPHDYIVELRNSSGVLYGNWSGDVQLVVNLGTITGHNVTNTTIVRPDNTLEINVNIGVRPIVDPPYAVWHLVAGGLGGGDGETPQPDRPEFGAAPWGSETTIGGGGWYPRPEQVPGLSPPHDAFLHLSQSEYHYYEDHQTIYWDRDDTYGYEYIFEYWLSSNPAVVQSLNVVGPGPMSSLGGRHPGPRSQYLRLAHHAKARRLADRTRSSRGHVHARRDQLRHEEFPRLCPGSNVTAREQTGIRPLGQCRQDHRRRRQRDEIPAQFARQSRHGDGSQRPRVRPSRERDRSGADGRQAGREAQLLRLAGAPRRDAGRIRPGQPGHI